MKVLLVSFSELPTLQRHLYVLASALQERGMDVNTIGSRDLAIEANLGEHNVLVDTPASPKPSISSLKAIKGEVEKLADIACEMNPDIVHFTNKHTWNYFLLLRLRRRLPNAMFLHTFHDPVGHEGDSVQKAVVVYHKLVQRLLNGIIVHSDKAQEQTEKQLRPKCPVYQVPLGEKLWRAYSPADSACRNALVFGRLNPYKGLKHYPAILDELQRLDPSIHVTVAGKASDEVDDTLLEKIASRKNCTLLNRFIDDSEVDGFFCNAGVVLVPYTSITQSGVILDAYSRSRPVVAFDIPGIAQFVSEQECLAPTFDCANYAEKVRNILNDSELRERISRAFWEFGRKNFSPERMAAATAESYMRIVGAKK